MAIFSREVRSGKVTPKMDRELEAARPKRILVLGSGGHGRGVTAYPWDKLPEDLNVADYDVVVLNFAAFEDRALAEGYPKERLPSRETLARLIFAPKSEIIAIGDPSIRIGAPPSPEGPVPFLDTRKRADYWLPCYLHVEENQGTSYQVVAEEWQPYFDVFKGWSWIATGTVSRNGEPYEYLHPVTTDANDLGFQLEAIAVTRFQKAIAMKVSFSAYRSVPGDPTGYRGRSTREPVMTSSPVIWLPAPTDVSASEAIDLLLRERHGVAEEARRPEWADSYSMPAEAPIAEEITQLEDERREVERKLADARQRATRAAEPNKLLYEKGEVLEPIVRAALRELSAEVTQPEVEGIEDGVLNRAEGAAVLEIKGREAQIRQSDVRQVVQWAADAQLRDGVVYKPIIVGNPFCGTRPDERGDPLGPNARAYAENGGVVLISTLQLYEALRQTQQGTFDEEAFWQAIFDSTGTVDLPVPVTAE
jgi:hypothetical protein